MIKKIVHAISTAGGIGYLPVAPGTWAALATTLIWYYLKSYTQLLNSGSIELTIILVITIAGIITSDLSARDWGKDPSKVVIDEVAGMSIALLWITPNIRYYVAGLILFRFFDILKPLGIKKMEKMKGGIGIMSDDVLAGIYSLIVLRLVIMTGRF